MKEIRTVENWMALATAYELLSLGFLLPTKETAQALVSGEFSAACSEVCSCLQLDQVQTEMIRSSLSEYLDADCDQVFHEIRREYTRLFVGEKKPLITPYLGVWEAGQQGSDGLLFISKGSIEIEHFMRDRGVAKDLDAGQINDPVDHIGTVFEFLKYLCLVNACAIKAPDGFKIKSGDYAEFLTSHFDSYANWLTDQVLSISRSSFYKASTLLLSLVLLATSCFKE